MRKLLVLCTAACALIGTADFSNAICLTGGGSATCGSGMCMSSSPRDIDVTWVGPGGAQCCDQITIFVDEGCDGGWAQLDVVDCSTSSYSYCGKANTDYKFKIVYSKNGSQSAPDIITNCVNCN